MWKVPFNAPTKVGLEQSWLEGALRSRHWAGDGPYSVQCEEALVQMIGCEQALLTTSCTDALEMAALLLDIRAGDEVVCPAFGFVSAASAFALRGARIVFGDVRSDTLNIDDAQLESLITQQTKAVVVIHYAGVGCAMDAIGAVCARHGVKIVEDNAHGLCGRYKGRPLGSFGVVAAQSFHETKNFTCGEGGALIVNDAAYVGRAEIIREKGTDRRRFSRGEVDKYTWRDLGSSFLPSDLLASVLAAQLAMWEWVQERRKCVWHTYWESLCDWAGASGFRLPIVPPECEQAFHMFYMLSPSAAVREKFLDHMRMQGILAVSHYVPLNTSPFGLRVGGEAGMCPVSEEMSSRLVRLPFYTNMTESDVELVVGAATSFVEG